MNRSLDLEHTTHLGSQALIEYDRYIQNVGFRYYGPLSRLKGFVRLSQLAAKFDVVFEMVNTRLPEGESDMKRRLRPLCEIPRMSTFAIGAVINRTVSSMAPGACFLNVGVWNGFTLLIDSA